MKQNQGKAITKQTKQKQTKTKPQKTFGLSSNFFYK